MKKNESEQLFEEWEKLNNKLEQHLKSLKSKGFVYKDPRVWSEKCSKCGKPECEFYVLNKNVTKRYFTLYCYNNEPKSSSLFPERVFKGKDILN